MVESLPRTAIAVIWLGQPEAGASWVDQVETTLAPGTAQELALLFGESSCVHPSIPCFGFWDDLEINEAGTLALIECDLPNTEAARTVLQAFTRSALPRRFPSCPIKVWVVVEVVQTRIDCWEIRHDAPHQDWPDEVREGQAAASEG